MPLDLSVYVNAERDLEQRLQRRLAAERSGRIVATRSGHLLQLPHLRPHPRRGLARR